MEIKGKSKITTLKSKDITIIANYLDFHSRFNLLFTNSHFKNTLYDKYNDEVFFSCLRSIWEVEKFIQLIENPIINIKKYDSRNISSNLFLFIKKFSEKNSNQQIREVMNKLVFNKFVSYLKKNKEQIHIRDSDCIQLFTEMKYLYIYFPEIYDLELNIDVNDNSNTNLLHSLNKNIKAINKLHIVLNDLNKQTLSNHFDNLFDPLVNNFKINNLELSVKETNQKYNYFNGNIEKISYNLSPLLKYFSKYPNLLKKLKFSHKICLDKITELIEINNSSICQIYYNYLTQEDFKKFFEKCVLKCINLRKLKISFEICNETIEDLILIINKLNLSTIDTLVILDSNIDSSDLDELLKIYRKDSFSILLGNVKKDKLLDYIDFILRNNNNKKFDFFYDPDNYFLPDKQGLLEKLDLLKQENKFKDTLKDVKLFINGKKGKRVLRTLLETFKDLSTLQKVSIKSSSFSGDSGEILLDIVKNNKKISRFNLEIIESFIFAIVYKDIFCMKLINYNESFLEIAEQFIMNNSLDKLSVCFILYPELINSMDFISHNIWKSFPNICNKITELFFYDTVSEKTEDDNYDFIELCEVIKLFPNLEVLYLNGYCREETWETICETLPYLYNLKYFNASSRVSDDFDFFSYECAIKILECLSYSKDLFFLSLKGKFNEAFFSSLIVKLNIFTILSKIMITGIIDMEDNQLEYYLYKIQDIRPYISISIKRL